MKQLKKRDLDADIVLLIHAVEEDSEMRLRACAFRE
jgi:hypothetical protein